jgi:hypothetical protein
MEHKEQKKSESGGLGLGLGLDVNLRLGELTNLVDQLTSALQDTGEKASDMIASSIRKMREASVGQLKSAKEKEGGKGEASDTYDRLVSSLQSAARRGEDEARNLLGELGEKVESAGEKTQEFARKDEPHRDQPR